jgi:four helix bundle protein
MSDSIRNFRDLIVWQKAIRYAKENYQLTESWPSRERFGLTIQVRRAAVSISSNIAEGHTRMGNEFPRFLSIARWSLAESESQLMLAVELSFVTRDTVESPIGLATELRPMMLSLIRKLDR